MSIAIPPSSARTARVSGERAVRQLEDRLDGTRQGVVIRRAICGGLLLASFAGLALWLLAIVDYSWELATAWRALWLLAAAAGGIAAIVWGWRKYISTYSLTQTAIDAENRAAQFGQRLRTTLDYESQSSRPAQAAPGLLDALHVETEQVMRQTDWNGLVKVRLLRWALLALFACFAGWFVTLLCGSEIRLAAGRALLLPLEYTTVRYSPETTTVKFSESVTVEAEVSGRPVATAKLRYRPSGSNESWTEVDLVPPVASEAETKANPKSKAAATRLHGLLSATLADLQHDLEFEVLAGPRTLPAGSIRVLQPLKVEKHSARIVPPEYTGRKAETVSALDLNVLEGSTVELALVLSRPAAEGTVTGPGSAEPQVEAMVPPAVTLDGPVLRTTLVDLRKSGTYTIAAKAADGITLDPVKFNVKVKLDAPPSVQFIAPPEELSVVPTADVPMVVEAADDLGLFKAGIVYQVGTGPLKTLWEDDAAGSTDPLRGAEVLMLEEHGLTFQDAVTYYAFAEDNYFGKPRRTTTPLRFIDIRPFKLAFQLSEGGGSCCGNSATLEELIQRQRQQLSQAFAATQQGTPAAGVAPRLAEAQSDLLEKTTEFWQGMAELAGPIPTLEEAVGHMQAAVEALEAAELPSGISAEQQALAALIKTRENIRKKLNQSPSASQCQKFDKAQQQKLRMPPKKEQDQKQQLAQARKKLDDLAQREREWSKQAQQACQNPSSGKSGQPSQSKPSPAESPSGEPMPSEPPSGETSPKPSREEVAKAQQKMIEELAEIQKQLPQLSKSSQGAQEQAERAAESMQKGLSELNQEQGESAGKAGERSAEELEQLAAHLAAMNAQDVGQRLDQAQKLAQELAAKQEAVEKQLSGGKEQGGKEQGGKEPSKSAGEGQEKSTGEKLASEERRLATQAKLLAEQLAGLARDAAAEPGSVGQKLAQLTADNPPQEIAAKMEQAAEDLKHQRREQAGRGVAKSRQELQELSRGLGEAKNQFAQPQLQELMKLEEQLAQLMKKNERAKEAGKTPDPSDEAKWQQLAARLEALAAGDKKLAEALRQLKPGAVRGTDKPAPDGVYPEMELLDAPNLREVAKALQVKIQEAILAGALMDADQPVPREYRELVDKYYRALSDDLR